MTKYLRSHLTFVLALILALFSVVGPVSAADEQVSLEIPTGDLQGGYGTFITQAAGACNTDRFHYKAVASSGSPGNLEALLNNDAAIAPVQMDVADWYRLSRDVSNLRLLLPLFPEQAHFVTRKDLGKKSPKEVGGFQVKIGNWTPGASDIVLNSVNDLSGWTVAAVGGSNYTAQMLQHPNVGNAKFVLAKDVPNNVEALKGLAAGKYDAVLMVTTQPAAILSHPEVKPLVPGFKLLPATSELMDKIAKFYPGKSVLSYQSMGESGQNIQTFQVMSVLLASNYTKGPYAEAIAHFRKCIVENAASLASRPKTHPAWRYIASSTANGIQPTGNWEVWGAQTSVAPTPAKKR